MSQYKKDMIASFFSLILGALVLISVPLAIQDPGVSVMGPRVFSYFIGAYMVILSLALILATIVKHRKAGSADSMETFTLGEERKRALRDKLQVLLLAAVILAYATLFQILGHFISTLLAATVILLTFRVKKVWAYPVVYAVAVAIWAGFTFLLSMRLPQEEEKSMIRSVLSSLFTLENLLWVNAGLAGGVMVGALPGLTGTMAIALLLPLIYGLASIPGVILLLGVYCGNIYGGSITTILTNMPGTPASVATSLDGCPMAQKGRELRALHDALPASTIGGLFSCEVLLFTTPPVANFALKFGPAKYFALAFFGLTVIASVGGKSQIRGLLMGFIGLLISCIGIDPMDGVSRFTFSINRMEDDIDTIPMLIGLFAIAEVMAKTRDMDKVAGMAVKVEEKKTHFRDVLKYKMVLLKSNILGVFTGAVSSTGAAISSFLTYNEAKRTSEHPEEYGHGSEEAVVASESTNNAVTGATLIPLLTLGIPGDTSTAVLLGAFTMQGIATGPQLFTQYGEWIYTVILGLIAVNIFMYLQSQVFTRGFVNIAHVPTSTLVPILVMLYVISAYAISYSVFNTIFMVDVGIFGCFVTRLNMPMTPMVIDLVLGKLYESNLRRAFIVSKGSWATFFTSPISLFFILLSLFMLFFPYIEKKLAARRTAT